MLTRSYLETIGWKESGRNRWELFTRGVLVAWMELDRYGEVKRSSGVPLENGQPVLFRRINKSW